MSSDAYYLVHKWTIDNFGHFYREEWNFNKIESSKFYLSANKEDHLNKFHLCLLPKGENDNNRNNVTLFLYRSSVQHVSANVSLQISIIDVNGDKRNTQVLSQTFDERHDHFGFVDYIRIVDLLEHSNELLHDDKLTLLCELHVNGQIKDSSIMSEVSESHSNAQPQVALSLAHKWTIDNFDNLYRHSHHWPIVLSIVESQKFHSPSNANHQFYLRLYPNGIIDQHRGYLSISLLHFSMDQLSDANVLWKFSILDKNGDKFLTRSVQKIFTQKVSISVVRGISVAQLHEHSSKLLHANKLDIFCEIKILTTEENHLFNHATQIEKQLTASVTDAIEKNVQAEFTWEVDNFVEMCGRGNATKSFAPHSINPHLFSLSPIFSPPFSPSMDPHRFYFRLYPNGANDENQNYLEISLGVSPQGKRQVIYSISLLDSVKYNKQNCKMKFGEPECGLPRYTSHKDLFNPTNKLLKDNKLIIHCEVVFVEEDQIDDEKLDETHEIINFVSPNKQVVVTPTQSITQVTYHAHRWTIDNFSFYYQANQNKQSNYLECSKFSPANDDQLQFDFGFRPKPHRESEQFEIFFSLISENNAEKLSADVIISVLNESGIICFSSVAYSVRPWKTFAEFDWKATQMEPKSINQLKLLFEFQIRTHYSSVSEMRGFQQSCEQLAIASNLFNKWQVKRQCDVSALTQAVTSNPVESCTYEWCITNFCNQQLLQSGIFSTAEHDFFLRLNNDPDQSQDTIWLYLCLTKSVEKAIKVCLKISILDKDGHKLCTKDNLIKLFEGELQYECVGKPFDKRYFTSNGLLLSDDTLTIFVELNLVGEPTAQFPRKNVPIRILPELKSLLYNRQPSDTFLQFSGGKLHFHKAVLSARSKVLGEMLNRTQDSDTEFQIDCIDDVAAAQEVLRFIYTGQVCAGQVDQVLAEKLLILSDLYQVDQLKSISEDILLDQFETNTLAQSTQQSVKFLLLAYKHNAPRLKERCIKIVNQNAQIIQETSTWNALFTAHPKVIADLYEDLVVNRNYKSKKKALTYSVK